MILYDNFSRLKLWRIANQSCGRSQKVAPNRTTSHATVATFTSQVEDSPSFFKDLHVGGAEQTILSPLLLLKPIIEYMHVELLLDFCSASMHFDCNDGTSAWGVFDKRLKPLWLFLVFRVFYDWKIPENDLTLSAFELSMGKIYLDGIFDPSSPSIATMTWKVPAWKLQLDL